MISLSRCELVIDFLGQLFCVLNEILYSLLVSEFCEPCLTDVCTKAKRPSFECSFCSKSYWYFEGTFGFLFLLIYCGHFHLYPRWKGRDQISEPVLLDRYKCFPVLMLLSFFARHLILCVLSTTPTFLVWVLKTQVFLAWYYSIVH